MEGPVTVPQIAVGAIVRHGESLLLIQRATEPQRGRWSLPGGRVEARETLAQAVEREVHEETGLVVTCGDFVGWVERISALHHFVILDFYATAKEAHPTPKAGSDAQQARFVGVQTIRDLDLVDGLFDFFVEHGVVTA